MTEKEELKQLKDRNKELLNIIADLSLRIECIKADVKKIQELIKGACNE